MEPPAQVKTGLRYRIQELWCNLPKYCPHQKPCPHWCGSSDFGKWQSFQILTQTFAVFLNFVTFYVLYLWITWHGIDCYFPGPYLLTWFNFNPSMDKQLHLSYTEASNYLSGATGDVYEWVSNFIPHFAMDLITYACWVNGKPCK